MNKQLLAKLEVSSSSSNSSLESPTPDQEDLHLQDHPEDWLIIDELQGEVIFPPWTLLKNFPLENNTAKDYSTYLGTLYIWVSFY